MHIAVYEELAVPASKFRAFRIDGRGWNNAGAQLENHAWVVPGMIAVVRRETISRTSSGRFMVSDRNELYSMRQQAADLQGPAAQGRFMAPASRDRQRTRPRPRPARAAW